MNIRNLFAALTAGGVALTVATIAPASAATTRPTVPYLSSVTVKLIVPSALGTNGSYDVAIGEVGASPSNCGFELYRYTDYYGTQYLGAYSGTSTTDQLQDYFGLTYYEVYPYDCNDNFGSGVYSNSSYPTTTDDPFTFVHGTGVYVDSSKYYGGEALETTSAGSEVEWNTYDDYNEGIVIATGPKGGIGTVYVNGTKMGTISFYSKTAGYKKVAFKDGTSSPEYNTVIVQETAKGQGKGVQMYLDAGVQNEY